MYTVYVPYRNKYNQLSTRKFFGQGLKSDHFPSLKNPLNNSTHLRVLYRAYFDGAYKLVIFTVLD